MTVSCFVVYYMFWSESQIHNRSQGNTIFLSTLLSVLFYFKLCKPKKYFHWSVINISGTVFLEEIDSCFPGS